MSDLRRELELLVAEVEFPPTPPLASATRARLSRERRRPLLVSAPRRRAFALAALVVLLMAGTVFAAVPGVRHAVLELFHLRGATVKRVTTLPRAPLHDLELGRRTSLGQARAAVPFRVVVPARYGAPDAAYLHGAGEVSLAYAARGGLPRGELLPLGLLVSEFRGSRDPDYVGKIAGAATAVRRLTVGGRRAVWIAGAPHYFFYRAPDGAQRYETLRLAGNVLLLERDGVLVRLEGSFGLREARAIAASLR